jgi:hypothetical protein
MGHPSDEDEDAIELRQLIAAGEDRREAADADKPIKNIGFKMGTAKPHTLSCLLYIPLTDPHLSCTLASRYLI